jgi:hypothetical protein
VGVELMTDKVIKRTQELQRKLHLFCGKFSPKLFTYVVENTQVYRGVIVDIGDVKWKHPFVTISFFWRDQVALSLTV